MHPAVCTIMTAGHKDFKAGARGMRSDMFWHRWQSDKWWGGGAYDNNDKLRLTGQNDSGWWCQ